MKHLRLAVALMLLSLTAPLQAQNRLPLTQTITVSGGQQPFPNSNGAMQVSFEEKISGSPSTVSIVIQGCKLGNTCETLDTYTTVADAIRPASSSLTKVYDSFVVTASWTGGSNVKVTINATLTTANGGNGSSSGAVSSVFTRTGDVVAASGDYTLSQIGAGAAGSGTFDFTGVTLLKARLAAGLTTTVNGDFGFDTTNLNWHGWNGADGIFPLVPVGTPVNGQCPTWVVSSGKVSLGSAACGAGVTVNNSAQFSEPYYSASGSANTISGNAPPTTNGIWSSIWNVTGGTAVQKTNVLAGVPVDATNPATVLYSDRASYLNWTSGSALAFPAITGNFASNFPFVLKNTSGGTLTLTPNAGAVDLCDGSATCTFLNNFASFVYQDSTTAPGHLFTVKFPTFAAFGSTCSNGLSWNTGTGFGCLSAAPIKSGDAAGGVLTGTYPNPGLASSLALVTPNIGAATGTSLAATGGVSSQTHNLCADVSGSGTAQACTTAPATFTVIADSCFTYTTTTTNSGAGLTVNANSLGAKSVAIPGASGWTTTLTASIIPANKPLLLCYDGTNMNVQQTGTVAAGGGVTSLTGDTTLFGNSSSTGAVTLSPTAQLPGAVFVGPKADPGASSAAATMVVNPSPLYFSDPRNGVDFNEEFINPSGTGQYGWSCGGTGQSVTETSGTAPMYGANRIAVTNTSNNEGFCSMSGGGSLFAFAYNAVTSGDIIIRSSMNATTSITWFKGLVNINSGHGEGSPDDLGVAYDTSAGDTNFMCVHKNANGTPATLRTSTGVPGDQAVHDFLITFTSPGHFTCYVDGAHATPMAPTTFTTASLVPQLHIKTLTTTAIQTDTDYVRLAVKVAR